MNLADLSSRGFYWWYHQHSRLLVFAVAFGLGPRIAAENLVCDLEVTTEGVRWTGSDDSPVPDFIEIDVLINFGVLEDIQGMRPRRRIWVDCVDWLRASLPLHIQGYDLLLREVFFESEKSDRKGSCLKWRDVHPLIRSGCRDKNPDSNLVVLSFGGVFTPYSSKVHSMEMPITFMRGVAQAVNGSSKNVVVFLPETLRLEAVRDAKICDAINIAPLARDAFRTALSRCSLLLCQPGLYTPFEAMQIGVPLALTFPMSFTQAIQSRRLANLGVMAHPIVFDEPFTASSASPTIESAEAAWFARSTVQWRRRSVQKMEMTISSFVRNVLDMPSHALTVPPPLGTATTAAVAIRHERQT